MAFFVALSCVKFVGFNGDLDICRLGRFDLIGVFTALAVFTWGRTLSHKFSCCSIIEELAICLA